MKVLGFKKSLHRLSKHDGLWFIIISLVFFYLSKLHFQVLFNLMVILDLAKITQNILPLIGHLSFTAFISCSDKDLL